ncbi:MAG: hypothetical protein RMJ87_10120, partial [Cytophagales bacterium]|nr:hypothetical protein [Cytophagales bacterium]
GKKDDVTGSSYIAYSELRDLINAIPCLHVLVMLDACHSGTFGQVRTHKSDGFFDRPGEGAYLQEQAVQKIIRTALSSKSRLYMTSGGENTTPSPSAFAQQFKLALLRAPDFVGKLAEVFVFRRVVVSLFHNTGAGSVAIFPV